MTAAWQDSQQKGSPLLLMLAFADIADDLGLCWPGYDHLAKKTRLSRRQVMRLVTQCAATGELWPIARDRQRSNLYIVTIGLTPQELACAAQRALDMGAIPDPDGGLEPPDIVIQRMHGAPTTPAKEPETTPATSDNLSPPQHTGSDNLSPRSDIAVSPRSDIAVSPDPSLPVIDTEREEKEDLTELWETAKQQLRHQLDLATYNVHLKTATLHPTAKTNTWHLQVNHSLSVPWVQFQLAPQVLTCLNALSQTQREKLYVTTRAASA